MTNKMLLPFCRETEHFFASFLFSDGDPSLKMRKAEHGPLKMGSKVSVEGGESKPLSINLT